MSAVQCSAKNGFSRAHASVATTAINHDAKTRPQTPHRYHVYHAPLHHPFLPATSCPMDR